MADLPKHDGTPPWERPAWLKETHAWLHNELARLGRRVTSDIERLKLSPWSAILRASTSGGEVYFKATLPWQKYEVALAEALAHWRPDCMLSVLAADVDRGWMLMPAGGERLRETIRTSRDFRHWNHVLPTYADVQIELADRVPELLALGLPDRRLAALPTHYERLLDDTETLRIDREPGITSEQYRRLRGLGGAFAELCEALASYGIPETLNNGDFGDGNIFIQNGRPVFFDWGDGVVSHPFYSLRVTLVSLEYSLEMPEGAPEFDSVRDVYLDAWTRYGSLDRLRAAFRLAQKLAAVSGALSWHDTVSKLEGPAREEYAHPVPALLQEFLSHLDSHPA